MDSTSKIRRKSYTTEFKLKVCKRSEEIGNRKAAVEFGVSEVNVRRWKQDRPILKTMKCKSKSRRGGRARWPELELKLRQWVIDKSQMKSRVTGTSVRLHAKIFARSMQLPNFTASNGWYCRFMKRSGLSVRCRTSVGQPLPSDWTDKLELFRAFIAEKKSEGNITPANIFNMDEVPCQFDLPGSRTISEKGEEDITIVTTGSEKKSFTVVLGVSASGEKLIPMVIFKRKTIPKEKFPSGILVGANLKGWINGELVEDWMKNVWQTRKSGFFNKQKKENYLLVYDACTAHLKPEVKDAVQKFTELAVIPGGLTKFLQPLDISVNKSFKSKLRNSWDEFMENSEMISLTKAGNRRKASFSEVCRWIVDAWKEVNIETIKNGFKKAGIVFYLSSENSPEENLQIDGMSSESEDSSAEENADPIVPMEIDEDSDDDLIGDSFDGFHELTLDED